MFGDCLVGEPGYQMMPSLVLIIKFNQLRKLQYYTLTTWTWSVIRDRPRGKLTKALTGWKKCEMCPIWKSIEKCGIDKNVTLFVDAVKITGIIPEV